MAGVVLIVLCFYTRPADHLINKQYSARIRYIDYGNLAIACVEKATEEKNNSFKKRTKLLEKAVDNWEKAFEIAPLSLKPEYLTYIGLTHLSMQSFTKAHKAFQRILELDREEDRLLEIKEGLTRARKLHRIVQGNGGLH